MATGQNRGLLRQLDSLFTVGTTGELTDGQLLERFATLDGAGAEHAFSTLVERHGPMVLRVCQSVLAGSHDTEDAFQATFLVLVKKARGLWVNDSLGPWLHQVALRTASSARSRAARRRKHERAAAEQIRISQTEPQEDLAPMLHEEINRLPDRLRLPLILCDLEGQTHEQAARHLGWPVGTVKSRQARGRERLRERLTRRGLAPTASLMASALRPAGLPGLVPESLVSSTTGAAIKFAATHILIGGPAAVLAQGVLAAMSMTRWIKVASVLLVAGATVSGVCVLAGKGVSGVGVLAGKGQTSMPVVEVNAGTFKVSTTGRGTLEVERSNEVSNQVESNVAIASILPDGTRVKKGELVAKLDSAGLRSQLINQRISTQGSEANFRNARLAREVAEIAVKEYVDGIYVSNRAAIQGEINLARSAAQKAKARLDRTRHARQKLTERLKQRGEDTAEILAGVDLEDRIDSAEQALRRETFALERAESKLKVLDEYTKPKTLRELQGEVEKARSTELSKETIWQHEKSLEASLISQIQNCTLYSPSNGMIVWDVKRADEIVSPKQRIFWVFEPDSSIMVNVKVPESMVHRVTPGQKARIEVDAFPGEKLDGVVTKVAELPDPQVGPRGSAPRKKVYSTLVKVDRSFGNFRPGMNAQGEILIAQRESSVVPAESVLHSGSKDQVAVKKTDGGFEWREVVLGDDSGANVEVRSGLRPGEQVALKPFVLVREGVNRGKNLEPTKPR